MGGKQRNSGSDNESIQKPYCRGKKIGKYAKGLLKHLRDTDAALCGFGLPVLCERLLSARGHKLPVYRCIQLLLGLKRGHSAQSFCWQQMLFGRQRSRVSELWRGER